MKKRESLITLPATVEYIATRRTSTSKPVRIDALLEQRMRDFMLSRRRVQWIELEH